MADGTLLAATLKLCGDDMSIDYVSPTSTRFPHLPHRGTQHSDLLRAPTPAQALAQQLSAAFHRLQQLAERLGRRQLPDYGHLHALVHMYGTLHRRYFDVDIQHGALRCAEPLLRAILQAIEHIYWTLAGTTVHHPILRRDWTRRRRRLRPRECARHVHPQVGQLQLVLQLHQTVQPRRLRF